MSLSALVASPVLKSAFELLLPVVHDVLGGGRNADKALAHIKLKALEIDGARIAAAHKIIMADQQGTALQRNWRPLAMFVFMGLLFYQVVLVTLVNALFGAGTIAPDAQLTHEIIQVIKWGMGGYIVGRSGEKIARTFTQRSAPQQLDTEQNDGMKPRKVPSSADVVSAPFMQRDK